jgi:lysophospholipase L1-like esterase/predicted enzyme related to lactoylglutathione lyase
VGTILAFGDSNTYGWHEGGRFPRETRWPGALEALLPAGWRVVEEGLGGRTTNVDDPQLADCNGLAYFEPCLHSHLPLDAVVVFLGVNDLKPHLGRTHEDVAEGMRALVERARAAGVPRVVVLASHGLAAAYAGLDAEVLDLDGLHAFRGDDPRHLSADGHRLVARSVARHLALGEPAVRELRVVVTAEDYDDALRFYADALGLAERESYASPDGRVTILEAGRATLELADRNQAEFIDRVEVGRRVAGHIRLAFEVADSKATARRLADAGAEVVAEPTRTPWDSLNARLETPGALQITLFEELG